MSSWWMPRRQLGSRSSRGPPTGHRHHHQHQYPHQHPSDAQVGLLSGLSSPGAFPCPASSPTYNVQFSRRAADGHLVAFGTESGQVVIVDTRVEATVRRDQSGPVGWGQTDRTRTVSSGAASTRRRLRREAAVGGEGPVGSVGYCRSWGVRQPKMVAQYRALVNCIFDLEWASDDRVIALGCGDGKVRVHDTETHAELLVLCGHGGSVKTVAANPVENDILLSGSRDGSFALWDTRSPQGQDHPDMNGLHRLMPLEQFMLATAPANRVPTRYLSPVEQVYRANYCILNQNQKRPRPRSFAGRDGEYHELAPTAAAAAAAATPPKPSLTCLAFVGLPCQDSVTSVCWMNDGHKFLTAGQDGLVKLWDTRYIAVPLQAARPADASTPGRRAPGTSHGNTNPAASSPSPSPPPPSSPLLSPTTYGRAVPPSGDRDRDHHRRGGGGGRGGKGARGFAAAGRVTGGDVVAEECDPGYGVGGARPYGVTSLHACDDGSRVAVCTVKDHISVYSYAAGSLRPRGTFTGNNNTSSYYIKARLSPDGSLLASGARDDAVCVWQVDRPGPPVARLMGHVNETTGLDFCRAEPLKLATCSDDETVRVWTIDPLRVRRNFSSSSARPTAAASSSSSAAAAATGSGERPVSGGTNVRGGTAIGRRGGGGGVGSGSRPIPVLPGVPLRGGRVGGGGGDGDGDGDDDDGTGRFVSRGKFGLGTARIDESACWGRGRREPSTGPAAAAAAGDDGAVGHLGRGGGDGGGRGRGQAGGRGGQGESGSERGEGEGSTMEVCLPHPPPTQPPEAAASSVLALPGRDGSDGGAAAVFSPRSPNKKAGAPRTPTAASASAGLAEAAVVGASLALGDAAAQAPPTAPGRADENTAPAPAPAPAREGDGGLTGVVDDAPEPDRSNMDMALERGRLDVGAAAVVVDDGPAGAAGKGSRGLLDGLPSGWSAAKGAQTGPRVHEHQQRWQQRQQQRSEKGGGEQQDGEEGREKPQKQKQPKGKGKGGGAQKGGRGATSRGKPVARDHPTLMDFWKKGQGAAASGIQGEEKAPVGTGLERRGPGS